MMSTEKDLDDATAVQAAGARWAWTISLLAIVGGAVLRWAQLGKPSLWFDEGYTAWAVSFPLSGIVRVIRADTAPPLYYILLRGWVHLFGRSEVGLRSMSALLATIGLFFFVAVANKLLKTPWAKTAAIVLFSFSFMQIAYAHEARFYAMITALGAIDLYLVLLVCERSSLMRIGALALAWTASLYTNNMMAVYLACLGIAWLVAPGARPMVGRFKDLLIVTGITAILFLPWLPTLLAQTQRLKGGFWPDKPDKWLLARTIGVLSGVHEVSLPIGSQDNWQWFFSIDVIVVGLGILACNTAVRCRRAMALLSFGLLPILLIFYYSKISTSIFMERAFLPSGIAMPLLAASALDAVRSKSGRFVAGTAVCLLIFLSLRSMPDHWLGEHTEDWRNASAFAHQSSAKHRLVLCVASDGEPLYRYYACNSDYALRIDVTAVPKSFFALDPPQTMQRIKSDADLDATRALLANGNYDEVVMIGAHQWWGDHDLRTLSFLRAKYRLIEERVFTGVTVFRFNSAETINKR